MKYHVVFVIFIFCAGLSAMQQPSAHDFATQHVAYVTDEVTGQISFSPGTKQAIWVFMQKALIQKGLMTETYAQEILATERDYCQFMPARCAIADVVFLMTFEPGNHLIACELLQEYKADPNATVFGGITCLLVATESNNVVLAATLLQDKRTNQNIMTRAPGIISATPLHSVARSPERLAIAKLLLDHPNTEVRCQDKQGMTSLCVALRQENAAFLELAIAKRKAMRDAGAVTTPYDELVSNDFFHIAACQSSVAFQLIEKARQD